MIAKNRYSENPTGPESASIGFPFSRGQVIIGLLLIAIGLTLWRQYETRFVAPRAPVSWQTLDPDQVNRLLGQRRVVLIQVLPKDPALAASHHAALDTPEFRRAVYFHKPLAIRTSLDNFDWQDFPALVDPPPVVEGGLIRIFGGKPPSVQVLPASRVTTGQAVELITGPAPFR